MDANGAYNMGRAVVDTIPAVFIAAGLCGWAIPGLTA
jgi:hypothetical protein